MKEGFEDVSKYVVSKVAVACDHAGLPLKDVVVEALAEMGLDVLDLGVNTPDRVDYPEYGARMGRAITKGEAPMGVIVCGSGIGISIAANRFAAVRAALCHDVTSARLSREHNDANVLALGARLTGTEVALDMLRAFLTTEFEGGRHAGRVEMLATVAEE